MSISILATKLYIPPPHPDLIPRPHLIERLNQGLHRTPGVTLISTPAGFGKTTLVSEWLQVSDLFPTWLSLGDSDNDPTRFLTYFIAALQEINPDIGHTVLGMLESPQPPPVETLITGLINEVSAKSIRFIIVLDDYHLIEAKPIHDALTFLLDHLPPLMHVVITSRTEPPLPLARLRGHGILTELRADDLRFSLDEATNFLSNITGLSLAIEDVALLDERIEGWAVGFQLAGLSLQGQSFSDKRDFLTAIGGDDRYIADYLVEEVLRRQPAAVQEFLLQTSILGRLTASLCKVVTQQHDSQTVLELLERNNLFIVPLDNKRQWYRYHRLLAELLQNRLQRIQPDLIPALHRRASNWYERNGWMVEALNHALSAGDHDRAAGLITQNARDMLKRGEATTLRRWIDKLPPGSVQTDPHLRVASAWARLLTGPFEGFDTVLEEAEQFVTNLPAEAVADRQGLLGEVKAIRAIASIEQGDTSPAVIQLAHQALDDLPSDNRYLYSILTTSLALAYHANGDAGAAIQTFAAAKTIGEQSDNIFSTLFSSYELAELNIEHGQLRQAEALHRQAMSLVEDRFGPGARHIPLGGAAHIGLGKLLYEWNDLEIARQHLEQGFELTNQLGGMGFPREASVAMAFLHQALGDEQTATSWMQQAENMARTAPRPQVLAHVLLHKVRLQLAQGQVIAVQRWAEQTGLDINQVPDYSAEGTYLTLVRLFLVQEDLNSLLSAIDVTAQLLQRAETQQRRGRAIEILILQALAHQALRQIERALKALENALLLAEPEGYIRRFIDEGQPMADLLQLVLARKITPGYTSGLLAASKADQIRLTMQSASQPLVESLTGRELEVLNLVSAGLSNKAIAEALFITVGTVKRHTMNIYGKLGVNSRTQATLKARELNLVE